MRNLGRWIAACIVVLACPSLARAQNWSFDAREIGLGGIGTMSNVGADMVEEQKPYRAIVLPFGLLQVIPNFPKMDPTSDEFDLVRAIEYAVSPLHYQFGREDSDTGSNFITDLRNGTLSRNLNDYAGFVPANEVTAEGLTSPSWGKTFKVKKGTAGAFQGIYVGAGPYFSMQTAATIDPALTNLLASPTPVYIPNTSFYMSNDTTSQLALAVTGGYRARIPWAGSDNEFEGLYIGANFHTIWGFIYEDFAPDARLDTDANGLLTVNLAKGIPVQIVRNESASSGRGFAIDVGASAVMEHWQFGLGVNGIANRINWSDVERTSYVLDSLFNGGEFQDFPTVSVEDVKVELPVDVRGTGTYNNEAWTATTEIGHGYSGTVLRGGVERRFERTQLRAGTRYIKEKWEPTFGAGFNFTERFGIDTALFGTSANVERERHWAIAFSFHLMSKQNQ